MILFLAMVLYLVNGLMSDLSRTAAIIAIVLGSLFLLGVLWSALYFSVADLRVVNGLVGKRDFLGRVLAVPIQDVAAIRLFSISSGWSDRPLPAVVLIGRDDRALVRVHGFSWSLAQIQRIAAAAGVQVFGSWDEVVSAADAENAHPGAATLLQRRPDVATVIALGAIFAASIIYIVLVR